MKKKLPNLYKGKVKNNSNNQKQSIINSVQEDIKLEDENSNNLLDSRNVDRQIKDIFSSPNFVYKADVTIITTDGEELKKTIIGRTNNSLITMDDELIDVSRISQIDFD